ncbi:thiamine-phosphate synthase [Spirochaetia bacterium]|nr:thiamine-phosphate synthase [Spirochaetia bacterium]
MLNKNDLLLYLCTDRVLSLGRSITDVVEASIAGGVTMIQLREKNASTREFYKIALSVQKITLQKKIPLVINDRLDIALAVGADGLHIGQSDMPVDAARHLAGKKMFIGVSASTAVEAAAAEKGGADYIGAGPVFPTGSKSDAGTAIGLDGLKAICAAVRIPVAAIGGINAENAAEIIKQGAYGAAVISAILSQPDIHAASAKLKEELLRARGLQSPA